eukprot:TRINITY_DN5424_c0_g1_i1.p1 TRINITY_DN5424_c0_g1~~TRINITY_DN5424_c0_g1_i1.p1  ORF type:complete len:70 (-),score=2.61 TRINITY_DN5424_c0_g1_i1:88-297(-)
MSFVVMVLQQSAYLHPVRVGVERIPILQKEGIHDDFGLYDSPDKFYLEKGTNLIRCKTLVVSTSDPTFD